jgi:cadmium resistance protein CadD (predicted permease)
MDPCEARLVLGIFAEGRWPNEEDAGGMDLLASSIGVGIVVFASTNIDDIFIVSAFFADPHLDRRSVVIGQFVGIGTLVLVSVLAALLAVALPAGWVALLGLVPLLLGISKLLALRHSTAREAPEVEEHQLRDKEHLTERRLHSQILAIAAVTVANGGDNLGVYIPLFASTPHGIPVYVSVFAVLTALWCVLGYLLVNNRFVGSVIGRYGHRALPFVLLALGLYILAGAAALLR